MAEVSNRIIKNTGYLYAKMAITMLLSLLCMRVVLNSLGVEDFGIYNVVGGVIGFLGFLNLSLSRATQRFISFNEGTGNSKQKKSIFNMSVVIHLIFSVFLFSILFLAGYIFFNGVLKIAEERLYAAKFVYLCMIVNAVISVLSVPYIAILNAHENMRYFSAIGIIESILHLLVAYIIKYSTFDKLIVYGILMTSVPLISLVLYSTYCIRKYEECVFSPSTFWNTRLLKQMLSFAGWNLFSTMAGCVSNQGRSVVGNMFYGVSLNAALAIAIQVDVYLKTFSSNMLKAVEPVIVKGEGAGNSVQKMISYTLSSTKMSFYIFVIFVVPFFIEMPYILNLWLKNVPEFAVVFCRFQLMTSLFDQLGATFDTTIYAHGKIKSFSLVSSVLYIISITCIYILFRCGMPPYIMFIPVILFNVVSYRLLGFLILRHYYDLKTKLYIKEVLFPCLTTFLLTLSVTAALLIMNQSLLRLLLTFVSSSFIFLCLLYSIGINTAERNVINNILCRLRMIITTKISNI